LVNHEVSEVICTVFSSYLPLSQDNLNDTDTDWYDDYCNYFDQ